MKKYDSYKECVIVTPHEEFTQAFTSDWTFREIESWMLDTYCIDKDSIITMKISSCSLYKISK